ncbi:type II toxin-antitoxin system RelE/ParE family toxin [Pectobacterium versatile]|uniref:type II toxin-antitoxin system RelE/ParE family toxin n=1 Tax=Pectobacterium versatile TaxID=2488639 RepID=UPI000C7F6C6E|nr:type II toxin-antitoxin system RelE/ParE family toxin [Pectobacterium versatile]PLY35734.1 addiction module toxin RelE [Pectobacterium carotovorum]
MLKNLYWIASARKDMKEMPEDVQDVFGYALYLAQCGKKHSDAKVMTGFSGAGVLEVVEDYETDTYRAAYTVKFENAVYVLHVFKKKSKKGIATPKPDMDKIRERLKQAEEHANSLRGK